jgi:murein DD-endopeptidase MepM/ murein hydrolase activator NlpD
MMAGANLALMFAAAAAGAVVIDYGVKQLKPAFASAGTSSSGTGVTVASPGGIPAGGSGGYSLPYPQGVKPNVERVDMGQDFTLPPGTPILSIADAKVTNIIQDWYSGQPLIETQILSGSRAGEFIYYAEGITPNVSVGAVVKAGQQIATATSQPTGLEFGFGGTPSGETLAQTEPGFTGDQGPTAIGPQGAGTQFAAFLKGLGFP